MPALTMDTPHEPQIRSQIITDSHEVLKIFEIILQPTHGYTKVHPRRQNNHSGETSVQQYSSFSQTTLRSLQFFEGNFCKCPLFGIKTRPQHQELHSLLFTRSTLVLKLSLQTSTEEIHETRARERMQDFCSSREKHID